MALIALTVIVFRVLIAPKRGWGRAALCIQNEGQRGPMLGIIGHVPLRIQHDGPHARCGLTYSKQKPNARRAFKTRTQTKEQGAHGAADSKRRLNLRVFGVAWLSVCGRWCVFVRSSAIAHASADRARASRRMSRVWSTGRGSGVFPRWGGGEARGGKSHSHGLRCVPSKAAS